jgi:ADP-heptose:LPS heptosyltransferase
MNRIANTAKVKPAPVTASYSDFASLLSSCEALLTPDTSVVHLGAAIGLPMVAYYPYESRALHYWTPVGVQYEMIVFNDASTLSPEEVKDQYQSLISKIEIGVTKTMEVTA